MDLLTASLDRQYRKRGIFTNFDESKESLESIIQK